MADPVISAVPAQAGAVRSGAGRLRFEIPGIWKRFLLALLGLILAFAAALFSSVARESGSLWTTVILASIALTLAVVVGLTTVPYLARRVAGGRVRDAFNYDVTGVGIIYVVTALLIGVAALNTGNNLLYVIVAAMLAAILVSGMASAVVLRDLELDIRLPEQVFAGRPTLGKIVIRNRRRWLPSFSISVVPIKQKSSVKWQSVPTTFGFPPGRPAAQQWVRLPDRQFRRVADDLYLIREYMPEDSARHVDWKATAKTGSLKVREFSREDERKLRIVFDNPGPGAVSEQTY